MLNIALLEEEQQRYQNDLAAFEAEIERETDLHSEGLFDGTIGCEPNSMEQSYWSGYEIGLRKYWAKKRKIELPTEF